MSGGLKSRIGTNCQRVPRDLRGEDADYVFLIPRDPEGTVEVGELSGIIHGPTDTTIGGTDVVVLRREHTV